MVNRIDGKGTTQLAPDIYEFLFISDRKLRFRPGQYLEWTLRHSRPDNRGNGRYFTIASSVDERDVRLGVRFYPEASSFKRALLAMRPGSGIAGSQLAGEFVLPRNSREKLVFVAGGIGITPFRSMIKQLLDHNEKREITVLYSNKTAPEIVYGDVLEVLRSIGIPKSRINTDFFPGFA